MQKTPIDSTQQTLKSRAEVQLLSALNHKKAKSASGYLKAEQERVETEEKQQGKRSATQNFKQFRIGAGKNALPASEQDEMIAAVRQLENHSATTQPEKEIDGDSPNQIEVNATHRRQKHLEAQREFTEKVKVISEDIELSIIQEADAIKETLGTVDGLLAKISRDLENNSVLLQCELVDVVGTWATIEATCQRRSKAIEEFGRTLEMVERSRVDHVGDELKQLTKTLMDTAHALPPEVERIIESEAYDVNVVVITNRRVYADLIARMATQDVDVFVHKRMEWERGLKSWRRLRHDDALSRFHAKINSSHYTDPSERGKVMDELRSFQEQTHRTRRIAALKSLQDAGANLTSVQAQCILNDLSETQRREDEKNAEFFDVMTRMHEEKVSEAVALREALRLEIHGFGALVQEGDIASSREKLASILSDDSLEDFFRTAGGLKNELDSIVKRLRLGELIYQGNLKPLRSSVGVLLSALPLERIMENQGKGAERKAVLAMLDKMRKAARHEIHSLLPALQAQVSMLLGLADTDEVFRAEVEDVGFHLRVILQDFQNDVDGASKPEEATTASGMTRITTSEISAPATSAEKSLGLKSFGTTSLTSIKSDSSTGSVDLSAIRRVQRRLGTLMCATELSLPLQEHLVYIAAQLDLQVIANDVVDHAVAASCDEHLVAREEESKLFLKLIGERVEEQNLQLNDQCERLARFHLRVAQAMEHAEDGVRFVNLSVMDLLDVLKDNHEDVNTDHESQYGMVCGRLRHAPDSTVLQEEFTNATDLLQKMETSYRLYQRRVALAAENHVIATHKQHESFLFHQCKLFGLIPPTTPEPFDLEKFLSVQFIDDATLPKPSSTQEAEVGENISHQASGETTTQEPAPHSSESSKANTGTPTRGRKGKSAVEDLKDVSPKETLRMVNGFELEVELRIPELLQRILTERSAEDGEHQQSSRSENAETQATSPPTDAPISTIESQESTDEESERQTAIREAREVRLKEVEGQVNRDFHRLEVDNSLKELLLEIFRVAVLTKFEANFKAHILSAAETQMQRLQQSNLLLEEKLRMHWPRKGRLDVQIYQPRISELYSHRQRLDRQIRAMTKKADLLQSAFDAQVVALQKALEDTRIKQVMLQTQLPLQQSLAALQGLEVKSNKVLSAFRMDSTEILERLRMLIANDAALLATLVQDYVRVCSTQVFPDLTSFYVISGCDFHPQEVMIIQAQLQAVESTLRDTVTSREAKIADLTEAQNVLLGLGLEFKRRYQVCLQSLSMREGLGQKYGLPRRCAQEKYRSETTRGDELSAKIDNLLASLHTVVESKQIVEMTRLPDGNATTQILHLLLRLRAALFYRGKYFGLLKNVSQLEPLPVRFDAGGIEGRPVITDRDFVEEDNVPAPATQFLDFVNQVAVKCREDTRLLYQQEGKLDDLPPSGVPTALEEYLLGLQDKAIAYVQRQEVKLREQVDMFGELLGVSSEAAMSDILSRSKASILRSTVAVHEEMQKELNLWMEQKNRNMLDLRPDLCSPNNARQLQVLCDKEAQRSEQALAGLRACRATIFSIVVTSSSNFEKELLALNSALTVILDSSVMTMDDLRPFTGEEVPKSKRKSLKRLRKLARIHELGDPREVKRSDDEIKMLTQLGEVPRFPKRAWAGIPSFGLHALWDSLRTELIQAEMEMNSAGDSSLSGLPTGSVAESDGACTTQLTPAHRCLIHARDQTYAEFSAFCTKHSRELLADVQERLRDEVKWAESWQLGIEKLRGQARTASTRIESI